MNNGTHDDEEEESQLNREKNNQILLTTAWPILLLRIQQLVVTNPWIILGVRGGGPPTPCLQSRHGNVYLPLLE